MKAKKIVSLFAALTMAATMISSFATVASADGAPAVSNVVAKMTNEDFNSWYGEDIPAGYDAYSVTTNVENLGELSATKVGIRINGTRLYNLGVTFTFEDVSNINTDYSATLASAITDAPNGGFDGSSYSAVFTGNASTAYPTTTMTIADGKIDEAFFTVFVVAAGKSLKVTNVAATTGVATYSGGNITDGTDKKFGAGQALGDVSYDKKEFVMGEVTPPEPVVTSIDIAGDDTVAAEGTATYTATVKDADGAVMADEKVTWSIKEETDAAAIDADGVLTAGKPEADTTVTVVATSASKGDVTAEKTVTISKYVAPVVAPTVVLTAEEGKDSAAGAYTFFYKAVVTPGSEAVTAADVTITSGINSRKAYLSADVLANLQGAFTFYVGNKTADAGRVFDATATVAADTTVTDTASYTTPAAE